MIAIEKSGPAKEVGDISEGLAIKGACEGGANCA